MPFFTVWDTTAQNFEDAVLASGREHPEGYFPVGLEPHLAWLLEVTDAQPVYDSSAERLVYNSQGVIAITPGTQEGTRTFTWTIAPLSQAALNQNARNQALATEATAVGAITKDWLDNPDAPIQASDAARVAKFLAIRDGLDEQAPQA